MECPDCKIEMEYIDTMYIDHKDSIQKLADPYWKCPKCRIEVDYDENTND